MQGGLDKDVNNQKSNRQRRDIGFLFQKGKKPGRAANSQTERMTTATGVEAENP